MHFLKFNSICIIGTHYNPLVAQTVVEIFVFLQNIDSKIKVFLEKETAESIKNNDFNIIMFKDISKKCDLVIVVGGDGNFLNAARNLSRYGNTPLIGINRGKLGFLTDINPNEIEEKILPILKGEFQIEKRHMLQTIINRNEKKIICNSSFNEVVISSGRNARLFEQNIFIDNQYAFSQRSDGIIISTPTGSTAHSLSAGGPIMHPNLNAFVLVPMFSHSLTARPLVINDKSNIKIKITDYNNPTPVISFDGKTENIVLNNNDDILISKSKRKITILHSYNYNYYKSLRTKLHWNKLLF